ncbi:hypothetical protein C8F04DRAFT_1259341 [Mycena alexandri]|uniref:Uncharacterized protein n=1 Tax=Mycena alexandri TaxID=1745969 RepID=A0AAD6SWH3_9AGAR|nr:hypothetical protein C8F04DRAFT_1259341 [Mycena alexandri]
MSVEDDDPLATALSHAFISSPSLRPEPQNSNQLAAASASTPTTSATDSSVSSESLESTSDAEYESHVESWRAQSAEAREKAEKERARWEAIRAAEKQEAALRQAAIPQDSGAVGGEIISDHGWETVGKSQEVRRPSSPSPADARDLVTGEPQKHVPAPGAATVQNSQSAQDTGDESQKWEDVSSHLTSSFPSLSFPDRTNTPSPHPPPPAPLESATLAIYDPSLSTRTRVTALFSSLAINFLLPFVNGVMLGFGEIFAKNIVLEYFGWRPLSPGTTAASRGLGATSRPSERTKSSFTSSAK